MLYIICALSNLCALICLELTSSSSVADINNSIAESDLPKSIKLSTGTY